MAGEVRNLYFVVLAVFFLAALVATFLRYYLRVRRSAEESWQDILNRLTWIDRDNVAMIAMDAITESGEPLSLIHI